MSTRGPSTEDRLRGGARRGFVGLAFLVAACGGVDVARTALHGDLSELKRDVARARKEGSLDEAAVKRLAAAVARRELVASLGAAALNRISDVRACVRPVRRELLKRADRPDEAGAAAALALMESGLMPRTALVDRHANSTEGAWRAVAARAATETEHASLRRRFFEDGDQRVRREALRAALAAHDAGDLGALLEVVRLDPDATSRSLAARAVGNIGGVSAVLGLVDLWVRADEQLRLVLVESWAQDSSFEAGGERQLRKVVETEQGMPQVAAASALVAAGRHVEQSTAALVRAIAEGSSDERRLAIRLAPVGDEGVTLALQAAANDEVDPSVVALALARLLSVPSASADARARLRQLAATEGVAARRARAALAVVLDGSVAPQLEKDLSSADPWQRRTAAVSLARLGRFDSAAIALADDDPAVRTSVACALLNIL